MLEACKLESTFPYRLVNLICWYAIMTVITNGTDSNQSLECV